MDKKSTIYHLERAEKIEQFEKAVKNIKGVTFVKVDSENMTFEYAIDEWSSDYDVFTEIMNIIDDYGIAFDFSYAEKKHQSIKNFEITGDEEMQSEFIAHGLESEQEPEIEVDEKPQKRKKSSETVERIIEIGASIVFFAISFFVKDLLYFATLALAFALSGYEVLFRAGYKIFKKQFISEELLVSIALIGAVFLGHEAQAVGACLIWTLSDFTVALINEKIKNGKVAYFAPDKLTVINEDETQTEVPFNEVIAGNKVLYSAGDTCVLDGVVTSNVAVKKMNGETLELNEGDKIFAGDKLVEECIVLTVCDEKGNLNYAYNQKVKQAFENKCKFENTVIKQNKVCLSIFFALCLIVAFVLPIFESTYKVGLYLWGYRATIVIVLYNFTMLFGSFALNIYRALSLGKKQGAFTGDYTFSERVAKSCECVIDVESILLENGEVKPNARGAIRELKDCDLKKFVIVTSKDEKWAEEFCKQYKIHEYYANRSEDEKRKILCELASDGALCVCNYKLDTQNAGASISFNAETQGYEGDACVFDGEIKNLPFAVKLAKRTKKTLTTNIILTYVCKLIIVGLVLSGVLGLLGAMAIDFAIGSIALLISLANGGEII